MTPKRWQEIERLCQAALERPHGERPAFLTEACKDNPELRREVESLLAHASGTGVLDGPAWESMTGPAGADSTEIGIAPGTQLGHYAIEGQIGKGGMGKVYRARDTRLGRDVAVKVLRESQAGGTVWERFEREARAASALNHPNICAVYDVGEAGGRPYLVMELVEGELLRDYVGGRAATPAVVIALGAQIADALEAAHAKGIIHRDIKAGNVMVTGRCHVKVLDFGLAKYAAGIAEADDTRTIESLTAAGTVVGTPHYMAPEILQGKPADARSDLWALGVVLHEMLTGSLPFQGSTAFEVSSAILSKAPPPLPTDVPSGLRMIVQQCLQKQPEKRFQTAREVRAALEAPETAVAISGRNRWLWPAGALAVLALGGVWLWQQQMKQPPQTAARRLSTGATPSASREANEAFELAMARLNQQDNPRAQELFQRAVTLDSHFAAAHQFLGISYNIQILTGESNDANQFYKADEELRRALQEDPSLLDVHSELAGVAFMQGDKQRALAELNQLSARDPRDHGWRLNLHYMAEENDAAKELALGILEHDPLFQPARSVLTEILLTEGDATGAIRHAQTLAEQTPNGITGVTSLSWVYMATGELSKARQLLEEKRALLGNNYHWRLAWALLLALENKREAALRAMDEETLTWADADFFATLHASEFYALLGDPSKAIEWLDRAVRKGDERVEWFRKNQRLMSIRNDPSFQRIIDSIQARRKQRQGRQAGVLRNAWGKGENERVLFQAVYEPGKGERAMAGCGIFRDHRENAPPCAPPRGSR